MSKRNSQSASGARNSGSSKTGPSVAASASPSVGSSGRHGLANAAVHSTMLQAKETIAKGAIDDIHDRSIDTNADEEMKTKVKRNRNTERANVSTQIQQSALLSAETRDAISNFNHVDPRDAQLWQEDMNARTVGMRSLAGQAIHHAEIEERENQIILDKERSIKRNKEVIEADKARLNTTLDDMQKLAQEYADQQQSEEATELEDPDDA